MKNILKKKSFFGALFIFGIFLVIYWKTCCPKIFWWNSAELTAAISTLGIPHPPGFPLYVLLGKFVSFLPFYSLAYKLNLLSGLFSALSLGIFFLLFLKFIKIFDVESHKHKNLLIFSSFLLILVTGLNYAFWIQAVKAEVYSLSGLIFALILLCGINFLSGSENDCGKKENQKDIRWIYLFAFISGLGMGSHNIILISVLPAFIFLFISYDFRSLSRPKNIVTFTFLFLLGCSVYLYLPLRAANAPAMNWGNPVDPGSVASAALAFKSFGRIGFSSDNAIWLRIKDVWLMIYSQFTLFPFLLCLTGFAFIFKRNLKMSIFLLLMIIGNSSTIIILSSEFISGNSAFLGYILPTIFSLGLLFGFGVFQILKMIMDWIKRQEFNLNFKRSLALTFSVCFFSISILPFLTFHGLTSLVKNDIAYNYGKEVLSSLKENSVLFVDNPNLYFILCAFKYAEGYREDVAILDRGLLRTKWNCLQERRNYPELFSEVNAGLMGEDLFLAITSKGLNKNIPIYIEFTERDTDLVDFLLPSGYVFKLEKKYSPELPAVYLDMQRGFENRFFALRFEKEFINDFDAQRMFVLNAYRRGIYYEQKGLLKEALRNFTIALEQDPLNIVLQVRFNRLRNRIQLAKI